MICVGGAGASRRWDGSSEPVYAWESGLGVSTPRPLLTSSERNRGTTGEYRLRRRPLLLWRRRVEGLGGLRYATSSSDAASHAQSGRFTCSAIHFWPD